MNRRTTALVAAGIGLIAATSAKTVSEAHSAERVPYEVVDRLDGVELRRYPETLLVETTAPDERTAFNRLHGYLCGTNATAEELAMTAPVKTGTKADRTETSVTMAFYLPSAYTLETAPVPTNSSVRLVTEPKRTLGIVSFSWYATRRRTERAAADLDDTLAEHGIIPAKSPFLFRYDPPLTPPFLRTNEVAIEIEER